ncbi:HU family DNA-binding protein [bacterium]|nr:HU family DNA-binding protein [bacterium]
MNKAELVTAIASKTKMTKSQIENYLDVTLNIIQKTVSSGEEVKIVGFGSFCKTVRKAKTGRNPKTGQTIKVPNTTVPRFKPGKEFKDLVKN